MAARHKITWPFGLVALCADEVCTEVRSNDLAQATICADAFFPACGRFNMISEIRRLISEEL